jgi:hypothetical protein
MSHESEYNGHMMGISGTHSSSILQKDKKKTKKKQPEQILSFVFGQGQCVVQRYLATVIPFRKLARRIIPP